MAEQQPREKHPGHRSGRKRADPQLAQQVAQRQDDKEGEHGIAAEQAGELLDHDDRSPGANITPV